MLLLTAKIKKKKEKHQVVVSNSDLNSIFFDFLVPIKQAVINLKNSRYEVENNRCNYVL